MNMKEEYHKWHSPSLDRDVEMLVFGYAGQPVILFPTSQGAYYQNKDEGMIEAAKWFVENGKVKIYCPDTLDAQTWYNKSVSPEIRAHNYECYDRMLQTELIPWAQHETGFERMALAGCSFGGYHAVNTSFRHPQLVSYCFSMSGAFDIRSFVSGFYDDTVYFNNPVDFIVSDNNPNLWKMGIVLGTSDHDICKVENERLSSILHLKNINHWLDVRPNASHDWPVWREMFPHYLSLMS
ncbi:MAG TPA: alpha/beta hydrolase-fold protein [Puia sp.]|jgi:esterase/lipase superfamily enzyme